MKLLTKSEIDTAKAKDRQLEVSEGLKVAKRVDSLRETQADEEASLERFRVTTVSRINDEIKAENLKLSLVKSEVSEYERRKAEALVPLDEEWSKVNEEKNRLDERTVELSKQDSILHEKDLSLDKRDKALLEQEQRADGAFKRSQGLLQDADAKNEQANKIMRDAGAMMRKAEAESVVKIANADEKERFVEEREKAVAKEEERLRKKEIQLAKDLSALCDREALLERNIKRNKK